MLALSFLFLSDIVFKVVFGFVKGCPMPEKPMTAIAEQLTSHVPP